MRAFIELQKKLVPDLLKVMQNRYTILSSVKIFQPIGRRALAENTKFTERFVRGEIELLTEQGLIDVTAKGMLITKEGQSTLKQLASFMNEMMGLDVLKTNLEKVLQVGRAIIVPGNSDQDEWVKQELGKACVSYLKEMIKDNSTIAVTGGTTMAAVASVMTPFEKVTNLLFVPARGGIGEKVENQANTIASKMAQESNSDYRLLYVPDPISDVAYHSIKNEPSIKEILQIINQANIVLHGIGDALTMAKRRKTEATVLTKLQEKKAVSEAFGYYFDKDGEIVHKVRTIGIHLEDLKTMDDVITVAGGTSKGKAIASYFKRAKSDLLITDEAAAMEILRETTLST